TIRFFCSFLQFPAVFFFRLLHVAISHFSVALLETFELGPTLFWCPEKATLSQPLSHSSIHLAISRTSPKCFIKPRLSENCKESLSFIITPVIEGCNQKLNGRETL
uniref:Uncharacterized protein n=1 Tax=Monodelphis domestica TaxID=13616 RepID=A0A5F8GH60_MONDO